MLKVLHEDEKSYAYKKAYIWDSLLHIMQHPSFISKN